MSVLSVLQRPATLSPDLTCERRSVPNCAQRNVEFTLPRPELHGGVPLSRLRTWRNRFVQFDNA
jgi:hypothetical protein